MKKIFSKAGTGFKKLITGKAFYLMLTACVFLIGIAGYIATKQTLSRIGDALGGNDPLWDTSGDLDNLFSTDTLAPKQTPEESDPVQNSSDPSFTEPFPLFGPEYTGGNESEELAVSTPPQKDNDIPASLLTPIYVMPIDGETLSPFSIQTLLYSKTMRDWRTHIGIDIKGDPGTRVVAITDGIVDDVYNDELYGWTVSLVHNNGLISVYRCLSESIPVNIGDTVKRGDVIGGISGDDSLMEMGEPPHLHFELIRDGAHIDPAEIFGSY